MKTGILFIALLAVAVSADAQSIKELLYSGKLKSDTGTVIRKGEDLSTKIDTAQKKPVEPEKTKVAIVAAVAVRDSLLMAGDTTAAAAVNVTTPDTAATIVAAPVNATKDNNRIWKDYIDSLTSTLRTDVLPNKKIKSGTYSVLIEYEIGLDGQTSINSVSCSPESSVLEQQIRERMTLTSPQMTPLLNNHGQPRKAIKKQMLTISK